MNNNTPKESALKGIDNVVFIYLNTYIALDRLINTALNNDDFALAIEGREPITANAIVTSADYLMGAALISASMQVGWIVDLYFKTVLLPLIPGSLVDDSWYSPDSIELLSGVTLLEVPDSGSFRLLNNLRSQISRIEDSFRLTQAEMLEMITRLKSFIEEFDARLIFENQNQDKKKRRVVRNVPKKIGDGGPFGADISAPGSARWGRPLLPGARDNYPERVHEDDFAPDPGEDDYDSDPGGNV